MLVQGKTCSRCGTVRQTGEFHVRAKSRDGLHAWCKPCMRSYQLDYYHKNKRRHPPKTVYQRFWRYGITEARFLTMTEAQDGRCAICLSRPTEPLVVDHDHACCPGSSKTCGQCVRGLLCRECNTGIGKLKDDPQVLLRAPEYVNVGGFVGD